MRKNYVVDTNVLIDNPKCIEILRNGEENEIYIPFTVLLELQKLKSESRLSYIVAQALQSIEDISYVQFIKAENKIYNRNNDMQILEDIKQSNIVDPILVTNDCALRIIAKTNGIQTELFNESYPFKSESELYTGIVKDESEIIPNCFMFREGKPIFHPTKGESIPLNYENLLWGETVKPKTIYQNMAMDLMLNDNIDVVSIQSQAGFGKSFIALAASFTKVFQEKKSKFKKIYFTRPTIEIGTSLGALPGELNNKLDPYFGYMYNLIWKLYSSRTKNNKILMDGSTYNRIELNKQYIELLPIQYIRGMNIDNSILIIDECQSFSKLEMRVLLSRCGENTKAIILGDSDQIDNCYLNKWNNGLNWCVKSFKGQPNYAHIVLKGNKSRGKICDLVLKTGL